MSYVNPYPILAEVCANAKKLAERDDVGALQVLVRQTERLVMGSSQYGRLDPVADKRNWRNELRAELLDALVYLECDEMRDEAKAEEGDPSSYCGAV